jgi:predicted porin
MTVHESYSKALKYLRDIELLNSNLDSLINSKSNEEFENILRNVVKKLSVITLYAEYYDNSDYTEQYLIVETGPQFIDFPEIEAKIGYSYSFTRGVKLSSCASYFHYKNKTYEPADKAVSIIEEDSHDPEQKAS